MLARTSGRYNLTVLWSRRVRRRLKHSMWLKYMLPVVGLTGYVDDNAWLRPTASCGSTICKLPRIVAYFREDDSDATVALEAKAVANTNGDGQDSAPGDISPEAEATAPESEPGANADGDGQDDALNAVTPEAEAIAPKSGTDGDGQEDPDAGAVPEVEAIAPEAEAEPTAC